MLRSIDLTSKLVDWNHTLAFHRPIFAAIERRCPEEARRKMIEHLLDARTLVAKVKEQERQLDVTAVIQPLTDGKKNTGKRG